MFELTVLFAGITTLVAMLVLNNLPLPSHPLDLVRRFGRSTDDKFFLLIEASDPKFDEADTKELLESTHAASIESVPEDRVTSDAMPKVLIYGLVVMTVLAAVPFALAAKARFTRTPSPRIHLIQDMDSQPKYRAQRMNTTFADERSARSDLPGTVAVGELQDDDHFFRGKVGDAWATTFPAQVELSDASMARGKERFGVYCTPCHGLGGEGNGMVHKHAEALGEGTWIQPTNITQEYLRVMPVGQLFDTITHGVRNMPPYGGQITAADRWNIIMYLRALQRTQAGKVTDVPESERRSIK
jgi:mono/diheme cytochrome c family protein